MNSPGFLKTLALDFLTGFIAFCVITAVGATIWVVGSDLCLRTRHGGGVSGRWIRSGCRRSRGSWCEGLALAAGGCLPVIILSETGNAFTSTVWPEAFACASTLLGTCGVLSRRLWVSGKRRAGTLAALVTFAGATIAAFVLIPLVIASAFTQHVNRVVQPFSISTLDGKLETSAELQGRVTVLAFWATWCKPCVAEYPALRDIHASFQGNPEVAFVAVNAGGEADTGQQVRAFVGNKRWTVPIAMDEKEKLWPLLGCPVFRRSRCWTKQAG